MMVYMMFTFVLMAFLWNEVVDVKSMLLNRLFFVLILGAVWMVYHFRPCRLTAYLRVVLVMFTLGSWYPDTYEFNRLFSNLDHVFSTFEHVTMTANAVIFFAGMTGWYAASVWIGHDNYKALSSKATGGNAAAPSACKMSIDLRRALGKT